MGQVERDEERGQAKGRMGRADRRTAETEVSVKVNLDGSGCHQIETGIGFFDHMLAHVALHGLFDLVVEAAGDLHVGPHHTVEDVALVLGQAFDRGLGDRRGIVRVGSAYVPMDETLASVTVDLSGRPYIVTQVGWSGDHVAGLPVTLIDHVFRSFATAVRANLHARVLYGDDDHHQAEALFKALGRALAAATRLDARRGGSIPSTKGTL